MTANVSDDAVLSFCQFIDNQSLANGAKTYFNVSVTGTNDQCSQNYTISLPAGNVINFTVIVNDTFGNINRSEYANNVIGQVIAVNSTNLLGCEDLDVPNMQYNLTRNVASAGTCMYIMANNITLDCKGFNINYSQRGNGYGIGNSGFNYSTLRSCNIVQNGSKNGASNSYGVYIFNNAYNNIVYNNSITTNSTNGYGVYLLNNASSNNVTNNTITTSGSNGFGVRLGVNANNNNVYSNTITTSGGGGDGVDLFSSSNNNSVYSNTITISGSSGWGTYLNASSNNNNIYSNTITTSGSSGYGAYLYTNSSNNNVYGNTITTSGSNGYGVRFSSNSNNNSVYSNTITTSGSSGYGVYVAGANNNSVYSNTITTSGSFGYGAYLFSNSSSNNVYSNNITTSGSWGYGVYLDTNNNNNNVYSNNITTSEYSGIGVYLYLNSSNNSVYSNTITASGELGYGVATFWDSDNNSIYSNMITISGSGGSVSSGIYVGSRGHSVYSNNITINNANSSGIYFINSYNATVYDNNITTRNVKNSYGIYLTYGSSNNTLYRNRISSLAIGILVNGSGSIGSSSRFNTFTNDTIVPCSVGCAANYKDIVLTSNATDITFTNVSFNKSRVGFVPRDVDFPTEKNNMTVMWYLTINVTNATNNASVPNAQVFINNSNATNIFDGITDSTGRIETQIVTEYTQNASVKWGQNDSCTLVGRDNVNRDNITCFSPYNITVNTSDVRNFTTIELNRSRFVTLSFGNGATADPDTTKPRINASLDDPTPFFTSRVNMTANVSDDVALSFCQFIDNMSSTGAKNYFNVTVTGANDQCSQNYTISLPAGNVINFTVIVNDTSNNLNQTTQVVAVNSTSLLGCEDLDIPNTQYNLTKNVASGGTCMYIMANNVTLDCKGFTINYSQSANGYGINNTGFNYSTIRSCNIVQSDPPISSPYVESHGLYISTNATYNKAYNLSIATKGTDSDGVLISNEAKYNNITNNIITTSGNRGLGIALYSGSGNNYVYSNTINTSGSTEDPDFFTGASGIMLSSSYNNSVYSNTITTNGGSSHTVYLSSSSNNTLNNNTLTAIAGESYGVYLISISSFNILYSNTISAAGGYGIGVIIDTTANNNTLYSNTITTSRSNGYGIYLGSNFNTLYSNTITTVGSKGYGAYLLSSSSFNTIYSNNITTSNTSSYGIYLTQNVFNNTIYDNNITTNNDSSSYGVYLLDKVSNNTFYKNKISSLAIGVLLNGTDTNFNVISNIYGNTFTNDTIVPCSVGCAANYKDIVLTSNATDITFTNVSFNKSRVGFVPRDVDFPTEKNNMTVMWYLTINVTNATNNASVPNAQVFINNSNATNIFDGITDSTGRIETQIVTEYTQNASVKWGQNDSCTLVGRDNVNRDNITCFSPYNITVNTSDVRNFTTIELNRSRFVTLSFGNGATADPDTTKPRINASLDDPTPFFTSRVNMTANVSDDVALSFCQFIDNMSSTGAKNYFNVTVTGANDQCSQNYTISLPAGNVINFTVIVNDTSNNLNQTTQVVAVNSTSLLGCEDLDIPNTQYNLTKNVASGGTCMYIMANNVTLDCKGFTINYSQSANGYGINNTGFNYSTIRSCNITQGNPQSPSSSAHAFYSESSLNYTIYNSTITTTGSTSSGIYSIISNNTRAYNNTITTRGNSAYDVYLLTSSNNSIYSNTLTTTGTFAYALYLQSGLNNLIYNNTIMTNDTSTNGIYLTLGSNNKVYSNTITTNGSDANGARLEASMNNTVYSNTIITTGENADGVSLYSLSLIQNNQVYNNSITIKGSGRGISVLGALNNSIYMNTITIKGASGSGIFSYSDSSNNNIYNNIIATTANSAFGMEIYGSNNLIYSNTITTNGTSAHSVYLRLSANNTIYDNNITTNNMSGAYGIYLSSGANNNTFYRNRITSLAAAIMINTSFFTTTPPVPINFITFTNDTIVPCSVGCAANYKDIILSNATDIFFLNVSMNKSRIAFVPIETDGTAEKNNMTVQWYLTINVTNATNNAPITNAQVVINDSFATNVFDGLTDATGGIGTQTFVEYTENGTINWGQNDSCTLIDGDAVQTDNITCFSPYNVSVNITGYSTAGRSLEVNKSMFVNMSMAIIAAANTAPVIKLNNATFSVDPVSGGDSIILISFNVTDADGVNTINASKAIINLTLGGRGGQFRFNISDQGNEFGTCNNHTQGNVMIINCTVIMKYYDNASSNWVINVSISDTVGNAGINDTVTFTYNVLSAISLQNAALNFSNVYLGQQNVLASPNLLMNNTGNDDFGQVNMSAAALTGMTTPSEAVAVTNFGVNLTNSSSNLRLAFPADGIISLRDPETGKNITFRHGHTGAFAPNADKGNISAFLWVNVPSSGLSTQLYNATWNITAVTTP